MGLTFKDYPTFDKIIKDKSHLLAFPEISVVMTTMQTPFGDDNFEMQF